MGPLAPTASILTRPLSINKILSLKKGKCGVCGDDFGTKRPRLNENGGKWGTGTIGKTYFQGQVRS